MAEDINKLGLHELVEKTILSDTDIMVIQDDENTKRVSFANIRDSLISDNELPSKHRIYSSLKIDNTMKEFQNQLDYDIGAVERTISEIADNYATPEKIDEKIAQYKTVADANETELRTILGSKRNTSDAITSDDIESGSDDKKIQLKNLSSEVLSAMTGDTPVTPPSVPDGGWVEEDIANGAITGIKLSTQYRFRGHYPEGDISNFTRDGLYLLGPSVYGLPKTSDDAGEQVDRLLEVFNYGPDNYIIQRVYYAVDYGINAKPIFERKALLNRLHLVDFVAKYEVTDTFKITRNILSDNIFDMGVIETGNLFDINKDGNYLVKKEVRNLPDNNSNFTVSIRKYDNRTEYLAKVVDIDRCDTYICNSYTSSSGVKMYTEWRLVNSSTKSKLEGKRLHLFGDGVCFGLGSSDISTLSYPALLNSRYGLKIINHALGDATIGDYGDERLSELSVITQIENAALSNGDFAIIFAGSEDYKTPASRIGKDTDKNKYYFKGALNICIEKLLTKNPLIKILMVSPLFRARLSADDFRNSDETFVNELTLKDFSNAMKDVCEYNHVPFLDLHSSCMINKYNYSSYLSDGLYLNDAGHDMITNKIFSALDNFY